MAFSFYRTITIDFTKVSANQVNFPVLISGVYSYLATVANAGNVTSVSGFDIMFFSSIDASAANKLDFELESYNQVTGEVNFWVRVPSLSASINTIIYIFYGDSGITTSQENKIGVWDSNYKGVWHLDDGTALNVKDSTNKNVSVNNGAVVAAGKIDGAATFNSTYIDLGSSSEINTNVFTYEAWIRPTTFVSGTPYGIIGGSTNSNTPYFRANGAGSIELIKQDVIQIGISTTGIITINNWHYVVVTYDASGNYSFYINSVARGTGTNLQTFTMASLIMGCKLFNGSPNEPFIGQIDEVRISNSATVRTASWITTSYNNQNSPSTFYTISGSTAIGYSSLLRIVSIKGVTSIKF